MLDRTWRTAAGESGSSQSPSKGFPQLKRLTEVYRLRRAVVAAVAGVAFVASLIATIAALSGHPEAGVDFDNANRIAAVSPTGFAWRDGIRVGQFVVERTRADAPGGWRVRTLDPGGPRVSEEAPVLEALRGSLPFALLGLAAGCLALGFVRLNRAWVLPSACLALLGASAPLFLANSSVTTPELAGAAIVPALAFAYGRRQSRLLAWAVALFSSLLVAVWAVVYTSGGPVDQLEEARRVVALAGTGLLMADRTMENSPTRFSPPQLLGMALAGLVIFAGLTMVYFASFPAPLIAIGVILALLALSPIRALLGHRLELALMADIRHQVAADVVDEERGRLARELHDQPLQELAAVIRRLELVPEARSETPSLMAIAEQLRTVAVDLRPPMLDDIGLGAALDFLADEVSTPGVPVSVSVDDVTGLERASRPPESVEFALYRIVHEAITNALKHAHAHSVAIDGRIAPDAVDLTVSDDGIGLAGEASRHASSRGRLGLASMRRRAQGIGAELSIDGGRSGTRVAVSWRA